MTVVAYDLRYIAVDSRLTQDNHICDDDYNKSTEIGDWVLFWSGSLDTKDGFISAFIAGEKFTGKSWSAFIGFDKKLKKVYYITCRDEHIAKSEVTYIDSIGSGCDHAITAMDCGKSAVEAVKMAIKRESSCGGTIRCFDTKTGKFIKVKS